MIALIINECGKQRTQFDCFTKDKTPSECVNTHGKSVNTHIKSVSKRWKKGKHLGVIALPVHRVQAFRMLEIDTVKDETLDLNGVRQKEIHSTI